MKYRYLRISSTQIMIYLAITLLIGFGVVFLALDKMECDFVSALQSFAQKTLGIRFFSVLSYVGDFYLWVVFSTIFFFYTYFKSRQDLTTSLRLAVYLILITASTYFLKAVFSRPRPYCLDITIYDPQASFSYPSGHVSRASGALMILSRKRSSINTSLVVIVLFLLSVSRIVLGAHFPTDVLGAVFLSFALHKATKTIVQNDFEE
jgi:membrane-associated phospholipid phosphatase